MSEYRRRSLRATGWLFVGILFAGISGLSFYVPAGRINPVGKSFAVALLGAALYFIIRAKMSVEPTKARHSSKRRRTNIVTIEHDTTTGKTTYTGISTAKDLLDIVSDITEKEPLLRDTPLNITLPVGQNGSLVVEHTDNGESATLTFHFNT